MIKFSPPFLVLRVVTRRELADWLDVDQKTLRKWQAANFGPVPFFKNNVALYDALQVEAFVALREVEVAEEMAEKAAQAAAAAAHEADEAMARFDRHERAD